MRKISAPQPNQGKKIRVPAETPINADILPVIFSLEHIQNGYCLTDCNAQEQVDILNSMFKRKNMSWFDLRNAPRHGLGTEKIERSAIQATIPPVAKNGVTFLALRFSGKKPMVGIREERVFYILWFDRNFSLYNHG